MSAAGLVVCASADDHAGTVTRLETALAAHGVVPAARIDHTAAANRAGLILEPLLLIIFGNPEVGTLLMQEQPSIGIDLPLRMLVWNEGGTTFIGYDDPVWLAERHGIVRNSAVARLMGEMLATLAAHAAGGHP